MTRKHRTLKQQKENKYVHDDANGGEGCGEGDREMSKGACHQKIMQGSDGCIQIHCPFALTVPTMTSSDCVLSCIAILPAFTTRSRHESLAFAKLDLTALNSVKHFLVSLCLAYLLIFYNGEQSLVRR